MKLSIKVRPILVSISPKRLFRSKRSSSSTTTSDPSSFGSRAVSSYSPSSVLPPNDFLDLSGDICFELEQIFKVINSDKGGVISRKELEELLNRLGNYCDCADEVKSVFDCVGEDVMRIKELSSLIGSAYAPTRTEELKEAFDFFDTDHDGKISADELLRFFISFGEEEYTMEDCECMIREVDKNRDGFVCFQDFAQMMEIRICPS